MDIIQQKKDELEKLVGKEQAAQLLAGAEKVEKEADAAGVAFKAESPFASEEFKTAVLKCMKEHMDGVAAHMATVKEYMAQHEKEHAAKKETDEAKAQATQIAALDAALKQAREQIAELQGETPRAAKGFRASQEGPVRAEPEGPQPNQAFKQFLDFAATGKTS